MKALLARACMSVGQYVSFIITGYFRKVTKFLMEQLQSETTVTHSLVSQVNQLIVRVGARWPVLTVQWCNLLILLNYDDQNWWKKMLCTNNRRPSESSQYVSLEFTRNVFGSLAH